MFAPTYSPNLAMSQVWCFGTMKQRWFGGDWLRRLHESVRFAEITYVLYETVLSRLALISLKKQHSKRVVRSLSPGPVLSRPHGCEE